MKKLLAILAGSCLMLGVTACGVQEDQDSQVASVAALANLKISAPNFRCGQNVVVLQIKNAGNADAPLSFLRVEQTFAPSTGPLVKALKAGETTGQAITVTYRNGQLNATIRADALNKVNESNENDNVLRLVCNG